MFRTLVSLVRGRRLAPLALFKCAPGRKAFRLDSFARIECLPHCSSLIRGWFFFFHGALKRRCFLGKGFKASIFGRIWFRHINTGELRASLKSLNLQGFWRPNGANAGRRAATGGTRVARRAGPVPPAWFAGEPVLKHERTRRGCAGILGVFGMDLAHARSLIRRSEVLKIWRPYASAAFRGGFGEK